MLTKQQWAVIQALREGATLEIDATERVLLDGKQIKRVLLNNLVEGDYVTGESRFTLTDLGRSVEYDGRQPRHAKHPTPMPVYMGIGAEREERIKRFDDIAEQFGGRAQMAQKIADGILKVTD